MDKLFRQIPKVDELLRHGFLAEFAPSVLLTQAARDVLDELRAGIQEGIVDAVPSADLLARKVAGRYVNGQKFNLRRVVNGTGIILHTNLGRAPLAVEALDAVSEAVRDYSNLEYDIENGGRSSRFVHVEGLLADLTGAEAAMVVNNNAAAVLLALAVLDGKEVIVSRGELVEIGGSFRIPDVLVQSGCRLVEVGTTNKTHALDYKKAISPGLTGGILRVHRSNFAIVGFTSQPSIEMLSGLAKEHDIPLIEDLGSGCLISLAPYGIHGQPTVSDSLKSGADVVTFSGDKLLGGPQAGLVVGRGDFIDKMKKHPLARAMRIDKLCLAALEVTLRLYFDPKTAVQKIPTLRMLCATADELHEKARMLKELLDKCPNAEVEVISEQSQAGGGSMPEENLLTSVVAISLSGMTASELEEHFRMGAVPIIGRITRNRFLLDARTIDTRDFDVIASRLAQV